MQAFENSFSFDWPKSILMNRLIKEEKLSLQNCYKCKRNYVGTSYDTCLHCVPFPKRNAPALENYEKVKKQCEIFELQVDVLSDLVKKLTKRIEILEGKLQTN